MNAAKALRLIQRTSVGVRRPTLSSRFLRFVAKRRFGKEIDRWLD